MTKRQAMTTDRRRYGSSAWPLYRVPAGGRNSALRGNWRAFPFCHCLATVLATCVPGCGHGSLSAPLPTVATGSTSQSVSVVVLANDLTKPVAEFPVTNCSRRPMRSVGVSLSCGCARAKLASDEIPPGGETVLEVFMRPLDSMREARKTVSCKVGFDNAETREYRVEVTALPDFCIPDAALSLGTLVVGRSQNLSIPVESFSRHPSPQPLHVWSESTEIKLHGHEVTWLNSSPAAADNKVMVHHGKIARDIVPASATARGTARLCMSRTPAEETATPAIYSFTWCTDQEWVTVPKRAVLRRADGHGYLPCRIAISRSDTEAFRIDSASSEHATVLDVRCFDSSTVNTAAIEVNVIGEVSKPIWGNISLAIDSGLAPLSIPYIVVP